MTRSLSPVDAICVGCELSVWDGVVKHCRWCNEGLPRGRSVWCSADCASQYAANHVWPIAKQYARERDRGCVDCREAPAIRPGLREVHHLEPCKSMRTQGCAHHLANLVLLCQEHHLGRHKAPV